MRGLDEALSPGPERARRILDERARILARVPTTPVDEARLKLLLFEIGHQRYGIETAYVLEAVEGSAITPIPGVPDHFLGVTSLRGEVVTTVDLARLTGAPAQPRGGTGLLVFIGQTHADLALFCDTVLDVVALPRAKIIPLPFESTGEQRHLLGTTSDTLLVLDGAAVLDDRRLFVDNHEFGQPA
jgi:purine-binding chemotaxis protein CheW